MIMGANYKRVGVGRKRKYRNRKFDGAVTKWPDAWKNYYGTHRKSQQTTPEVRWIYEKIYMKANKKQKQKKGN